MRVDTSADTILSTWTARWRWRARAADTADADVTLALLLPPPAGPEMALTELPARDRLSAAATSDASGPPGAVPLSGPVAKDGRLPVAAAVTPSKAASTAAIAAEDSGSAPAKLALPRGVALKLPALETPLKLDRTPAGRGASVSDFRLPAEPAAVVALPAVATDGDASMPTAGPASAGGDAAAPSSSTLLSAPSASSSTPASAMAPAHTDCSIWPTCLVRMGTSPKASSAATRHNMRENWLSRAWHQHGVTSPATCSIDSPATSKHARVHGGVSMPITYGNAGGFENS